MSSLLRRLGTLGWVAWLSGGCGPDVGSVGTSTSRPRLQQNAQAITAALTTATVCESLAPANAVYLYVSATTGNNSTAIAGDRTLPYATMTAAVNAIPSTLSTPYVIEFLDSSTYAESVVIAGKTTSSTNTLTVRTAPNSAPRLAGSGGVPLTISTNYTTIQGLNIQGSTSFDGVVLNAGTTGNQFLCNVIQSNARGLVASSAVQATLTLEGNRILSNESSALVLTGGSTGLVIRRNVIAQNGTTSNTTGPALDLTSATTPEISNNTFYNNATASTDPETSPDIRAGTGVTGMVLKNNVLSSNTTNGNKRSVRVAAAGAIANTSQYNLYYYPSVCTGFANCPNCGDNFSVGGTCRCFRTAGGNCGGTASWQSATSADTTGSTQADPRFADIAGGDFHEQSAGGRWTSSGWVVDASSSPVLDTGNPADAVTNEAGPNGGRINRGAYGGGPQASRTPGVKAVVIPTTGTAGGAATTVTVQLQTASGTATTISGNYRANLTFTGSATSSSTNVRINSGTSSRTFTLSDSVAEDVTVTLTETSNTAVVEVPGKVGFLPGTLSEVTSLVALSSNGQNVLLWNNPSRHDGVVVLRSTSAAPNTAPTAGATYAVGATIGNATVVYTDVQSYAGRMTDRSLTNGTRYYYRVFNKDAYSLYAPGQVPTSSGIFSEPTGGAPSPTWCYNVGLPSTQQPYVQFGTAVYTSSNARSVTSNLIVPGASTDGSERWRPSVVSGVVQSRATVVPLTGRTGQYILTGDQDGYAYAINAQTGSQVWVGNGGAPLTSGTTLQAQPAVQLAASSNSAFTTKWPSRDLVYFATSGTSSTGNKVHALSSANGAIQWTFPGAGTSMDIVSGGLMVDYTNNRLWVASRAGSAKTQPSLWIIDTLTGTQARAPYVLGEHVDAAVVQNPINNQAYVVTTTGMAYGYDLTTMAQLWSLNLGGAVRGYLVPVGKGFIASTSAGVQRYEITPGTPYTVRALWPNTTQPTPTVISGASAGRIDFGTNNKVYVSDNSGRIHKLDLFTGADLGTIQVSNTALGMPALDATTTPRRLYVGGLDGRLCATNLF